MCLWYCENWGLVNGLQFFGCDVDVIDVCFVGGCYYMNDLVVFGFVFVFDGDFVVGLCFFVVLELFDYCVVVVGQWFFVQFCFVVGFDGDQQCCIGIVGLFD